jgi:predicted MFS family arabinose efflux permease
VFFVNVPIAAVVLTLVYTRIPESRTREPTGALDIVGSLSITASLACIIVALIQMQTRPADALALGPLAVGTALFVLFLFIERSAVAPVTPLRLFRQPAFSFGNAYTFLLYAALNGATFFVPFELINVMRYSPASAGEALLPTIGCVALFSPFSGMLVNRTGARAMLVIGAGITAIGVALLARLGAAASYLGVVLPATLAVGVGLAAAVTPLTTAVMGATDADDVGAASGINNSISRVAGLIAVAIFGLIIATAAGGDALPSVQHPQGFRDAMLVAAIAAAAAAAVAARI